MYKTLTRNIVQKLPGKDSSRVSDVQNRSVSSCDKLQLPEKQTKERAPRQDSPGRLSGDISKHKLGKFVAGGEGIVPHSARALHIREVKQDASVNSAMFRFTKGLGLRNTSVNTLRDG